MWPFFGGNMRNLLIFVSLMPALHSVGGQHLSLREEKIICYEKTVQWAEAQAVCRKNHTDLITIRNETDVQALNGSHGWIGLHRDNRTTGWKWSKGDEKATYFNWDANEPSRTQHCVTKPVTKWRSGHCNATHAFICYDEILILVRENKTWEEALEHCRTLKIENRYNLATLTTPDDHDFAREKSQQATTDEVWTGLRYLGDDWFWMGGEPVWYKNIPSCPAVRCGVLEKNSNTSFGIRDCSQRRNFLCYMEPKNL